MRLAPPKHFAKARKAMQASIFYLLLSFSDNETSYIASTAMKPIDLAEKLFNEQLLSASSRQKIIDSENRKTFSLNFELKTLLYSGILLLTSGLGIAVYWIFRSM